MTNLGSENDRPDRLKDEECLESVLRSLLNHLKDRRLTNSINSKASTKALIKEFLESRDF